MDPQEQLMRQKKSLESAEFERKLFEQQAKDLEEAIEARREEMKRAGDEAQKALRGERVKEGDYSSQDIEEVQVEQKQIEQINAQQQEVLQKDEIKQEQNQSFIENARAFLKERGHAVDDADLEQLKEKKPQRPDFPVIMVSMAVFKDILDMILTATLVGIILVVLYSFFYLIVSFVWTMTRVSRVSFVGKQAIKAVRNRAVKKWAARNGLELIPGVQVLPLATLFVILTHYSDTKLVQTFIQAAEMLEGMIPEGEEE